MEGCEAVLGGSTLYAGPIALRTAGALQVSPALHVDAG